MSEVRLQVCFMMVWFGGCTVRVLDPLGAICCSGLDENMFTLRAETRAYSCVMHRGGDGQNTVPQSDTVD